MTRSPLASWGMSFVFGLGVIVGVAAGAGTGCGGGSSSSQAAEPSDHTADRAAAATDEETDEQKLERAQAHAMAALCERLYHCAVEDTPPETAEDIRPEELESKARAECEEEASQSDLSPRQIKVVQDCIIQDLACDDLQVCLDQARKPSA